MGPGKVLDSGRYVVVAPHMRGNGFSLSSSNTLAS